MKSHRVLIEIRNDKLQKIHGHKDVNDIKRIDIEIVSATLYCASFLRNIKKNLLQSIYKENIVNLSSIINILDNNDCSIETSTHISKEIKNYNFKLIDLRIRRTSQTTLNMLLDVVPSLDAFEEIKLRLISSYGLSNPNVGPMAIKYCEHNAESTYNHVKTLTNIPDRVICSGHVTTLIMPNGTKYQVRKSNNDGNDYEKAFMMAWLYSLVGEKVTRKTLKKFEEEFIKTDESEPNDKSIEDNLHGIITKRFGKNK